MKLADWMRDNKVSPKEMADRIGVTTEAVRLYMLARRVPREETMREILLSTNGAVEPNDFFDMSPPPEEPDAPLAAATGAGE